MSDLTGRRLPMLGYLLGIPISALAIASILSPLPNRDSVTMLNIAGVTFPLVTCPVALEASALMALTGPSATTAFRRRALFYCSLAFCSAATPGIFLFVCWRFVPLHPREFPLFLGYLCSVTVCLSVTWCLLKRRLANNQTMKREEIIAVDYGRENICSAGSVDRERRRGSYLVMRRTYIVIAVLAWMSLLIPFSPVFDVHSRLLRTLLWAFLVSLSLVGLGLTIESRARAVNYIPVLAATIMSWYVSTVLLPWYATH